MDPYKILGVNRNDSIESIKKKYKKLALKYHPDRNRTNKELNEETFKQINSAYDIIVNKKNGFADIDNEIFYRNFTEKLINKGKKIGEFIKNMDKNNLKDTIFTELKNYKNFYDNYKPTEISGDLNINVNMELSDIYNNVEKVIDLDIAEKCDKCLINDFKFCIHCDNTSLVTNKKKFIFNSADKLIIFHESSHYELNKKRGNINIKINPKINNNYKIIDNYNIYYEILIDNEDDKQEINRQFKYLDNQSYIFSCSAPFNNEYIIENKGLSIPYSEKRGNLIIKIVKNIYQTNNKFTLIKQ